MKIEDRIEALEAAVGALTRLVAHYADKRPFPLRLLPFGQWAKDAEGNVYRHTEVTEHGYTDRGFYLMSKVGDGGSWFDWQRGPEIVSGDIDVTMFDPNEESP